MRRFTAAILLCVFSALMYAQNQRIIYEYTFKLDSLNRAAADTEVMLLDIKKDGSHFYSASKMVYDSLVNEQFLNAGRSSNVSITLPTRNYKVSSAVTKSYPSFETVLHTHVNLKPYAIKENRKMEWKILPQHSEIGGMKVQKAQTSSGGRKWIAWFTTEIQLPDGPYRFAGLPGLILSVEDEKGDHQFKFIESKKLAGAPQRSQLDNNEIVITGPQFNKLWKEYANDPAKDIRQMLSQEDAQFKMTDKNGKELSHSEIIRKKELSVKNALQKTNNFIELDLYKR